MELKFKATDVFRWNQKQLEDSKIRLIVNRGSTRSSKTYSIIQLLIVQALSNKQTITIVSETLPKIRKTVLIDFKNIMGEAFNVIGTYNKTEFVYTFPNKSIIQYISADSESKIRGMSSDIVFIDECNAVSEDIYTQLSIRTLNKLIVAFNPTSEFYITDYVNKSKGEVVEYVSTYKQNPFLSKLQLDDIQRKGERDENFRRVFELGLYGTLENLVFKENLNWQLIDRLPNVRELDVYGMDWGYVTDPNALIHTYIDKNNIYIEECMYEGGLLNKEIAKKIKESNPFNAPIVADNSEQKTIADMRLTYGINIQAIEGKEIIDNINYMKQLNFFITKDSVNVINEFRNYSYSDKKKDRKGRFYPLDTHNHAIDALRYVVIKYVKPSGNRKTIRRVRV